MKAYKKLQTKYHAKVQAKNRDRIKCAVIAVLILLTVVCFTGLVIGLSLGFASPAKCHYYNSNVQYCGYCTDVSNDTKNCGNCGHECAFDAVCLNSKCVYCTYNCSTDNDFCTVEPCNASTGCSIFDCAADNNPCTLNPCNSTLGGCTPLDCNNDNDFCTVGTCNPTLGGCPIRNCSASGDPCLTDPCVAGACAYQCPVLQLNPPLVNLTATIGGGTPSGVKIIPGLILYSIPDVIQATATIVTAPLPAASYLNITTQPPGWTSTYGGGVLTITSPSAASANAYSTVLRSIEYSANINTFPKTVVFQIQVTNAKNLNIVGAVDAIITFTA